MLHKREISFVPLVGQHTIVANWGKHCFDSIYSFIHRENTNLIIGMDHSVSIVTMLTFISELRLTNFIIRGIGGFV